MPEFPENTGFKLPGLGSKEINTPSNFRKDQGVEDVGYCDNTESHMLPEGSSPLFKIDPNTVVPEYYKTSYSKTNWPTFRKKSQGKSECADGSYKDSETGKCVESKNVEKKETPKETPENKPKKVDKQSDKVRYTDLPEEQREAARKWNLEKHGTHKTTELSKSTKGKKGFDTSFDYTGDRDEAMKKKRKKMGY